MKKYAVETVDSTGRITTIATFVDKEDTEQELQRQWDSGNVTAHISEIARVESNSPDASRRFR